MVSKQERSGAWDGKRGPNRRMSKGPCYGEKEGKKKPAKNKSGDGHEKGVSQFSSIGQRGENFRQLTYRGNREKKNQGEKMEGLQEKKGNNHKQAREKDDTCTDPGISRQKGRKSSGRKEVR